MDFFRTPVDFTRFNAGTRDDKGRYTPPDPESEIVEVLANIQSFNANSLTQADVTLLNDQGVFSFDGLKTVFASSELYSPATSPAKRGDRFTEDGFTYEIRTVNKKGKLIPHWHCTASIVDPNT